MIPQPPTNREPPGVPYGTPAPPRVPLNRQVEVVGIDVPFADVLTFVFKVAVALVPVVFIFAVVWAAIFGGLLATLLDTGSTNP